MRSLKWGLTNQLTWKFGEKYQGLLVYMLKIFWFSKRTLVKWQLKVLKTEKVIHSDCKTNETVLF